MKNTKYSNYSMLCKDNPIFPYFDCLTLFKVFINRENLGNVFHWEKF